MHSPHQARWGVNTTHAETTPDRHEAQAQSRESSIEEEEEENLLDLAHQNRAKRGEFHDINPQDLHLIRLISDGSNAFADVWEASCHMKVRASFSLYYYYYYLLFINSSHLLAAARGGQNPQGPRQV
jgi:hypothetical protein